MLQVGRIKILVHCLIAVPVKPVYRVYMRIVRIVRGVAGKTMGNRNCFGSGLDHASPQEEAPHGFTCLLVVVVFLALPPGTPVTKALDVILWSPIFLHHHPGQTISSCSIYFIVVKTTLRSFPGSVYVTG